MKSQFEAIPKNNYFTMKIELTVAVCSTQMCISQVRKLRKQMVLAKRNYSFFSILHTQPLNVNYRAVLIRAGRGLEKSLKTN